MWIDVNKGVVTSSDNKAVALMATPRGKRRKSTGISLRIAPDLINKLKWREGSTLRVQLESKNGLTGRFRIAPDRKGDVILRRYPSERGGRLAIVFTWPTLYTTQSRTHPIWKTEGSALICTLPNYQGAKLTKTPMQKPEKGERRKISAEGLARLSSNLVKAREMKRIYKEMLNKGLIKEGEDPTKPVIQASGQPG